MTKEEKISFKKARSMKRAEANRTRNHRRWQRTGHRSGYGYDCPYAVDMYGVYGSCTCGGVNWDSCAGDI